MRSRWSGADGGELASIEQIIEQARLRIPGHLWDHAAGGAGTEATLRRNIDALASVLLRPRVLAGTAAAPDIATSFLGIPLAMPVMLAPVGPLELYDGDGSLASARAAAAAGIVTFVSVTSSPDLATVAREGGAPAVFQLYVRGDRDWVERTVLSARDAGYRALCITVDAPVYGRRERDIANRFVHTDHIALPNLPERAPSAASLEHELVHQGALTWADVDWIAGLTDLPLILKGVMDPRDARAAVEHGAAAVYVSNHGGRLLDHMQAPIEVLPAIVDEVGADAEVIVDGGFLHGEDVAKAVALGARAVLLGKLQCWGLAAGGTGALVRVLELIGEELERTLPQLGVATVAELTRDHVLRD
jgi:isopentenyl diphosphate isomerase/L-lactate dehydrogenase-like FMN-dependent dehydrogenase